MSALAIYLFVLFVALLIGLVMWLGILVTAIAVMLIVLCVAALDEYFSCKLHRL